MPIGWQELIWLALLVVILNATGLWPLITRALRELRGEHVSEPDEAPRRKPTTSSDMEVCYRLLGVSPSAPWEEIERAFRRKAHVHHPDRGGDEDAMRALNEAYAMLKRARGR